MTTESESRPAAGIQGAASIETGESSGFDNRFTTATTADVIYAFRREMESHGIAFKGDLKADDELHRVHVEGDRKGSLNGWYVMHLDGVPAGAFGNWRATGELSTKWSAKGSISMSPEESKRYREEIKAANATREAKKRAAYEAAAKRARKIWADAEGRPAPADHPYLAEKRIQPHGLRVGPWVVSGTEIPNALLVPVWEAKDKIVSLQAILPGGKSAWGNDKFFLPDGRTKWCYYIVGQPKDIGGLKTLCVSEGFATASSIFQSTGIGCLISFNAGNMVKVAKVARSKFPKMRIVLCADDDRWTPGNPGLSRAQEAADAVGVPVVVVKPEFSGEFASAERKLKDFNDLASAEGEPVAKRQIMTAIEADDCLASMEAKNAAADSGASDAAPDNVIVIEEGKRHIIVARAERLIARRADLFKTGGTLVRVAAAGQLGLAEDIVDDEGGRTFTDPLKPLAGEVHPDWLTTALSAEIRWQKPDGRKNRLPVWKDPPKWAAGALIAHQDWPNIRPLAGITSAPIIRRDGAVRTEAGYDPETGMLLASSERFLPIQERPGKDEAIAALKTLRTVFQYYRFSSGYGLSAALSLILTRLARHLIPLAPFHLITAASAGSGKTNIANVASIVCDGVKSSLRAWPEKDDAELRKSLTTCVISGQGVVTFDNIRNGAVVSSPILDQFLTATIWEDRILGVNRNVRARNNLVLAGTGNNVRFAQDSIRRVVVSRVLVDTETPWLKHYEWTPDDYAMTHRHELLQAACTILSAFICAGKPEPTDVIPLGTFEPWSRLVRNCLLWLGLEDPCAGQDEFSAADETTAGLADLLAVLRGRFGSNKFKAADVLDVACESDDEGGRGELTEVGRALVAVLAEKGSPLPSNIRLGKYFEGYRDKPAGGLALICHRDKNAKVNRWTIGDAGSAGISG